MIKAVKLLVIGVLISINAFGQFEHNWSFSVGSTSSQDYLEDGVIHTADHNGSIYITAKFPDVVDFDPSSAVANLVSNGGQQSFVAKYDNEGNYLWAKNIPESTDASIVHLTTDSTGDLIVVGRFNSITDFDPGPGNVYLMPGGSWTDCFIAKYTADGALLWVKQLAGSGSNNIRQIVSDASNNLYVSGYVNGNVDLDPSISTAIFPGTNATYLAKYSPSGDYVWGGVIDNLFCGNPVPVSMVVDENSLYYKAKINSTIDADIGPASHIIEGTGNYNHLVLKYSLSGEFDWGFQLGGGGVEEEGYLAVDENNIYLAAEFTGTVLNFNLEDSTDYLGSINGAHNVFLASYDKTDLVFNWVQRIVGAPYGARVKGLGQEENALLVIGTFSTDADFDPTSSQYTLSPSIPGSVNYVANYSKAEGNLFWAAHSKSHHGVNSFSYNSASHSAILCGSFSDTANVNFSEGNSYLFSGNSSDMYVASYTDLTTEVEFVADSEDAFRIYPNPAGIELHVSHTEDAVYSLFSSSGKLMLQKELSGNGTLDLTSFNPGMYFLHGTDSKSAISKPLIISR